MMLKIYRREVTHFSKSIKSQQQFNGFSGVTPGPPLCDKTTECRTLRVEQLRVTVLNNVRTADLTVKKRHINRTE